MRTGVSRDNPYGTGWSVIENGIITNGIRQIALGKNTVWALDNEGNVFFRSGVTLMKPEGLKWVHIPANVSNISVSFTDQVELKLNIIRN